MNISATIANSLWAGSNVPAWARFRGALRNPGAAQASVLKSLLQKNVFTEFGRTHGFEHIGSYEEFRDRVPLADYADLEPWIDRVRNGEDNVLVNDPVTHLVPTSGSTSARKLIPFTKGLQHEFNRAIGPWIVDLMHCRPRILTGKSYWSITPRSPRPEECDAGVKIGLEDDASYLGGTMSRLVRFTMVIPEPAGASVGFPEFQRATLTALLRCRDLRLISIWHPSFLTLLMDTLRVEWDHLLSVIHRVDKARADELESADPDLPGTLWPDLQVLSCWCDGAADQPAKNLRQRFPGVFMQSKGLLATEGVVTIPFSDAHPVAVRSHFYEFIDPRGRARRVHELREGGVYEVVITTSGGLWRYRLNDRVVVTGFVESTPSLKFLNRAGNVTDISGEKLSETFVADVICNTLQKEKLTPRFVMLAPDISDSTVGYTLYYEGRISTTGLAASIEGRLIQNPQYACCRNLNQLRAVAVFLIRESAHETYIQSMSARGARAGEVKPALLNSHADWSDVFIGRYLHEPISL